MKAKAVCWEDLIFEYRRKDYGAYRLRCGYPCSICVAAGIVILFFLGGMIGPMLLKQEPTPVASGGKPGPIIKYTELASPPLIEKIHIPQAPKTEPVVQQKVAKKMYVPPKATPREVKAPEEAVTVQEAKMDSGTSDADAGAAGLVSGGGGGTGISGTGAGEGSGPVLIQKDPEFPGGKEKLMKWLRDHLQYPPMAVRMGIEGNVQVSFAVGMAGEIQDVRVLSPLHRLCDAEAVRLISSMPNWIPGEINGKKSVTTYAISICFKLT